MSEWFVWIIERGDEDGDQPDRLEKKLGPYSSERMAERAHNGLFRQLDHDRFYLAIYEGDDDENVAAMDDIEL